MIEALIGEERGDADGVEIGAVRRLEDQRHVGAAATRGDPVLELLGMRLGFQQRIGAFGNAHARQRRLRLFDQRAVQRNLRRLVDVEIEHRDEMRAKQFASLRIGRAGIHVLFPIGREPVDDQILVDDGRLAAQHQIDLERLVDEARVVDVLLDLLLEPQDEPRPHQALQRRLVGRFRRPTSRRGRWLRPKVWATGVASSRVA